METHYCPRCTIAIFVADTWEAYGREQYCRLCHARIMLEFEEQYFEDTGDAISWFYFTQLPNKYMWTRFMDMASGGSCKEKPYEYIYIESASEEEAKVIFYNRFGHNPERITCTCCGEDYSISSHESFAQLSGYDRNCKQATALDRNQQPYSYYLEEGEEPLPGYRLDGRISLYRRDGVIPVAQYILRPDVLVIEAKDVKPEERAGEVPEQGYYWRD